MSKIKITHGLSNNGYFVIAQPKREYDFVRFPMDGTYTEIELTDPATNQKIKAELHSHWSFNEKEFLLAESLARLAYGWPPEKLKPILLHKYPELADKFQIEYWLLKKIDKDETQPKF